MTSVINSKIFSVFRLFNRGKEKGKYKFPRRAVKIRRDEGNEFKLSSKVYVESLSRMLRTDLKTCSKGSHPVLKEFI